MEVAITTGLLAIVLGGSMGAFEMMSNMNHAAEAQAEVGTLVTEANAIVGSTNACTTALAGTPSASGQNIALSQLLQTGSRFNKYLNIDSLSIENVTVVQGITRRADVTFSISRNLRNAQGASNLVRTIPLYYTVDAANQLADCTGPELDIQSSCAQLGGTFDPNTMNCDFCLALGGIRAANGTCQIAPDPQAQCLATGGTWNPNAAPQCDYCALMGGTRNAAGVCSMPFDPQVACVNLGGIWDSSTTPGSCSLGDLQSACLSFGGTWDTSVSPPVCNIPQDLQSICVNDFGGVWDASVSPPTCTTGGGNGSTPPQGSSCVRVQDSAFRRGNINIATSIVSVGNLALTTLKRRHPRNTTTAADEAVFQSALNNFMSRATFSSSGNWPTMESQADWTLVGSSGDLRWSLRASRSSLFRGDCSGDPSGPPWCEAYSTAAVVSMCALP